MPPPVRSLYDEASNVVTISPRAACALLRVATNRLCDHLGATERDINKKIAQLTARGLDARITKALDVLRVFGNSALHPLELEEQTHDPDTAQALFSMLNLIVEQTLTRDRELDELHSRMPDEVLAQIVKRDTPRSLTSGDQEAAGDR